MAVIIQIRKDTAANWTSVDPILADGEIGMEDGTPIAIKIGDGITAWTSLAYWSSGGGGGAAPVLVSVSSNYTALAAANTIYLIVVTAAAIITLPTAVGNTCLYIIKKRTSGAVSVAFTSGQNADGSTSVVITNEYDSLSFFSDNSNFNIF